MGVEGGGENHHLNCQFFLLPIYQQPMCSMLYVATVRWVNRHNACLFFFFFFSPVSVPPRPPVSPVWLPSRLLCSVVQFRTWLSFHIHFQSPSKSAPLIASMCIHSHNAEAEKWTANQRNPVHLSFLNIFEVCRSEKEKCYILWWILIFEELVSLCFENLPCHRAELYICQQLKGCIDFLWVCHISHFAQYVRSNAASKCIPGGLCLRQSLTLLFE